jgi:anti-anti-sigma regulatory factor
MSESISLTIDNVREYRTRFLRILAGTDPAIVDFSAIPDVDLAGVQLLVALVREAEVLKKSVRITGALSPAVVTRLASAGICAKTCDSGEQLEQALRGL